MSMTRRMSSGIFNASSLPVSLWLSSRIRVVRILVMPERRGPAAEAQRCYEDIDSGEAAPRGA